MKRLLWLLLFIAYTASAEMSGRITTVDEIALCKEPAVEPIMEAFTAHGTKGLSSMLNLMSNLGVCKNYKGTLLIIETDRLAVHNYTLLLAERAYAKGHSYTVFRLADGI